MRTPAPKRIALVALTLAAAACATGNPLQSDGPFDAAGGERELVTIDVLNNNFGDVTLWALRSDAERIRLGNVTGKTDARFSIPWRFSEPMRIEIDMVAGPRCVTENITVDPGDVLQLEIQPVFQQTAGCR